MPPRLINDYLTGHLLDRSDQDCLVFAEERISYSATSDRVDQVAKALLAAGVQRGDRIGFFSNARPEFFISFLAASSIGAIWVGLNPKYSIDELAHVIDDARPTIVFCALSGPDGVERSAADDLAGLDGVSRLVLLGDGAAEGSEPWAPFLAHSTTVTDQQLAERRSAVEPTDPAFLVYTSGSTGRPKGALISHRAQITCTDVALGRKGLRDRSIICNLPINHVGAVGDICIRTVAGGGTVYFQETFSPTAMMELISTERLNTWGGVPTIFQMCLNHPDLDSFDLTSVDLLAWGGAGMPVDLLRRLMDKTNCRRCTMGYGSTETVGGVTFSGLEDSVELLSETVGTPDDRLPIRIWHPDGRVAEVGEPGEVQAHRDFTMTGYWERPEESAEVFTGDWFHTGDLAVMREDGYIQIVGRLSDMFKSGGYNVYPREVELRLEEHPLVGLCAVVSVPDETFQEVGHAYVMPDGGSRPTVDELRQHARGGLANYKVPKQIFVLDELPMLPLGKVDKVTLKQRSMEW